MDIDEHENMYMWLCCASRRSHGEMDLFGIAPVPVNPDKVAPSVDVFISFRFAEAIAEARALRRVLEGRGFTVFLSEMLHPGSDLQREIAGALSGCRVAAVLATKTYGQVTS
jgi:hypothetical protein